MIQMFLITPSRSFLTGRVPVIAGELKEDLFEAQSDRAHFQKFITCLNNSLRHLRPRILSRGKFKLYRAVRLCLYDTHTLDPGNLRAESIGVAAYAQHY